MGLLFRNLGEMCLRFFSSVRVCRACFRNHSNSGVARRSGPSLRSEKK